VLREDLLHTEDVLREDLLHTEDDQMKEDVSNAETETRGLKMVFGEVVEALETSEDLKVAYYKAMQKSKQV
jgi:hypothetical protein